MAFEFKKAVKPQTLERVRNWLKEGNGYGPVIDGAYYVALEAGRIVGCVCLKRRSWFATEVRQLFVLPERRGHGVGAFLVQEGLAKVKTPLAIATVRDDNAASLRVFERSGFARWTGFGNPETGHNVLLLGRNAGGGTGPIRAFP